MNRCVNMCHGILVEVIFAALHFVDWLRRVELAKCIADPKCAANVACLQTCNGRPDETECQVWQFTSFLLLLLSVAQIDYCSWWFCSVKSDHFCCVI